MAPSVRLPADRGPALLPGRGVHGEEEGDQGPRGAQERGAGAAGPRPAVPDGLGNDLTQQSGTIPTYRVARVSAPCCVLIRSRVKMLNCILIAIRLSTAEQSKCGETKPFCDGEWLP